MDSDKLITMQQLEIEGLKESCKEMYTTIKNIHTMMYCIGGPLNDNILRFTREQQKYLMNVGNSCAGIIEEYRGKYND